MILQGPFDAERARAYALTPLPLAPELALFPLTQALCDHRAARLGLSDPPGSWRPINDALRLLGVTRTLALDEFDAVGLARFRDFDEPLGDPRA